MSIHCTIILDSGFFLINQAPNGSVSCSVGYFQCDGGSVHDSALVPDIRVYVDGEEKVFDPPIKLGNAKSNIDVQVLKEGNTPLNGMKVANAFYNQLLKISDLYGKDVKLKATEFDCLLRFNSGSMCGSMVKNRKFKRKDKRNNLEEKTMRPIAHNISIHYQLEPTDHLYIQRDDGRILFSSKDLKVENHFEVEFLADNWTAERFYRNLIDPPPGENHWLPNQGDPPPADWPKPPL